MRPLSTLSRIGTAASRSSASNPSANVCVFCLRHTRLPFSTSTPRSIDPRRKLRKIQGEKQKRYQDINDAQRSPEQLLPRIQHEQEVEWKRVVKLAERNGEPPPDKNKWRAQIERERRRPTGRPKLGADVKQRLQKWQQSFNVALQEIELPRATNWDGMEMVGGEVEWDTGLVFDGFLPETKLSSNAEITAAMYRAVVEVFTAVAHGEDLTSLRNSYDLLGPSFNDIKQVKITIAKQDGAGGNINLQYPSAEVENRIHQTLISSDNTDALEDAEANELNQPQDETALEEQIKAWGTQWHRVTITDPQIKFAIIKRLTSLIGTRIPDPAIHAYHTAGSLLADLAKPPPPASLHETLAADEMLRALPNLSIQDHKLSLVEKETTVGRWKVIRSELTENGLPVLNTAKVRGVDEPENEALM